MQKCHIYPPEMVKKAEEMDLLTYLQNYEPHELIKIGNETYTTKTHDSIRISNGLWNWFSKGIGGKNAISYLIDNDEVGRNASKSLQEVLSTKYKVLDRPPPIGKDCNDYLRYVLRSRNFNKNTKEKIKENAR